ncbi:thiol:disulfide interchange protein DsbA/DsbL [Rhodanobacter sp. DHB23]|uniref:thiol:disulfide interchange protein DsbA/DsbL n=1 Tax=Rhodanobacter sp. DHB23 TaxID=2775923 RepID=UPI0017870E13|nr:thiol:disulfide interchange protein DsbA/DsbL [Rhodanobacter sp. DHB23]MBD8874232.1 thiol:disulfide interchange protein DsbA/DsbL [Rhodanobacter sp. DHB23]
MLKRLPFLCATVLALAACGQSTDNGTAAPAATSTTATAPAAPATAPATAGTAPASATTTAPAADASAAAAPAAAATAAAATPAAPAQPFVDNGQWVEGKDYFRIDPAQPKYIPTDKIEVVEVFSYACPACNSFHGAMDQIEKTLPANAVVHYLPAAFRPDENWPVYQRAFFAAEALGVRAKAHDAFFDATWKTGETATYDLSTGQPKPKGAWPTIADIAKFYAKYGVDPKEFVAVANSFSVNTKMKQADDLMKAYGVGGTPTIVVDGKYRFSPSDVHSVQRAIELTQWLVAKEAAGK